MCQFATDYLTTKLSNSHLPIQQKYYHLLQKIDIKVQRNNASVLDIRARISESYDLYYFKELSPWTSAVA